jgi:hypothetical protein
VLPATTPDSATDFFGFIVVWSLIFAPLRKDFFFEKKKQKTFDHLALVFPERLGPNRKSFLVLFFKKEHA